MSMPPGDLQCHNTCSQEEFTPFQKCYSNSMTLGWLVKQIHAWSNKFRRTPEATLQRENSHGNQNLQANIAGASQLSP